MSKKVTLDAFSVLKSMATTVAVSSQTEPEEPAAPALADPTS